ncbi:hypothetical protein [Sutcliffiella cohnii]|uniref:hypothetical protein n=2 Tax=Bacillaceae TaxID=186817 RepID=UPI0012EECC5C|nr:hypothetical protein [Sutcliffiella cohnii]
MSKFVECEVPILIEFDHLDSCGTALPIRAPMMLRFFMAKSLMVLIVISSAAASGATEPPTARRDEGTGNSSTQILENDILIGNINHYFKF